MISVRSSGFIASVRTQMQEAFCKSRQGSTLPVRLGKDTDFGNVLQSLRHIQIKKLRWIFAFTLRGLN